MAIVLRQNLYSYHDLTEPSVVALEREVEAFFASVSVVEDRLQDAHDCWRAVPFISGIHSRIAGAGCGQIKFGMIAKDESWRKGAIETSQAVATQIQAKVNRNWRRIEIK